MDQEPTRRRTSMRLPDHDYSAPAGYFLTFCIRQKSCLLGRIVCEEMQLNRLGRLVEEEWLRSFEIRTEIARDEFVVMPNHLHGIVWIRSRPGRALHLEKFWRRPGFGERPLRSISSFAAGFKATSTGRINRARGTPARKLWQRSFFDHVIRDEADHERIREYIRNNPREWRRDRFFKDEESNVP